MSRSSALLLLGILVLLVPFIGIPSSWTAALEFLWGVLISAVGFSMRSAEVRRMKEATKTESLVEAETAVSNKMPAF